jgi:amino acid transporter
VLAVFVALGTVFTIFVISTSYSQIIELFPSGGGGYLVASKLLSPTWGMISGCALLIDYVLTIAISIASGADAVFSFLPSQWYDFKLGLAVAAVLALTVLNMRGAKESVLLLVPVFLVFIVTHIFFIGYALVSHLSDFPAVTQAVVTDAKRTGAELGLFGLIVIVLRAYSMGAGTFTGIEAVSNGLPVLREPRVQTARRTMRYMAISLSFMVLGLMLAYLLYRVEHQPGRTLNAVLFGRATAGWPTNWQYPVVLITLLSEAAILFVAAQSGFLDGPRVLANMALDRWMPTRFAILSDRLVTQNGILLMGGAAVITMLWTHASVTFLVVLYSINVFMTFTLSQLGMVVHWWNTRQVSACFKKLLVNVTGLVLTTFILVSVIVLKFRQGGWVTLIITGTLVAVAMCIKRHYEQTGRLMRRLDGLVAAADSAAQAAEEGAEKAVPTFDPNANTAVLLVNGFNGLGLHSLFAIFRLFGELYKNFVFVQIGIVDAGNFKGYEEIEGLEKHIKDELAKYVEFVMKHGHYAESVSSMGTDVADQITQVAIGVRKRFPQSVFFAGQLVFPSETLFTRCLHNYIAFSVQRRLYQEGVPFVILPIRV